MLRRACLLAVLLLALPARGATVPDTMEQRTVACTACHRPADYATPDGYVPRLAGKPAGYLYEQMRNFRDGRRPHEGMARLLEFLDDRYLTEIAAYFAALAPSRHAVPSPPIDAAMTQRATRWVQQGDKVLGVPACTSCHGTALTGVAPNVPGLVGLPADYVVAQLGAWRQGIRHARAPDCMERIARALPAADIPAIARWLALQPLPANAAPASTPPPVWPLECGANPQAR